MVTSCSIHVTDFTGSKRNNFLDLMLIDILIKQNASMYVDHEYIYYMYPVALCCFGKY